MWFVLSVAACGDDGEPAVVEPSWTVVLEELDSALMSVTGTAADDVWTVGAKDRGGGGALILHYDGSGFERVSADIDADLWWVHAFPGGTVLTGGSDGTIARREPNGDFEVMTTPGSATVYGIWGADEDDVFAVGGDPDETPGFVWHFDGEEWSDLTDELPEEVPPIFKVFGHRSDDVWMVGMDGTVVHWDGDSFELGDSTTTRRLFTVHGGPAGNPAYVAVGGFGSGVILEYEDDAWHDVTPQDAPQLFGVCMASAEEGYAVGSDGAVLHRDADGWAVEETEAELYNPFHAVWIDPEGGVWAVGGDVLTPLLNDGMLLHRGEEISGEISD